MGTVYEVPTLVGERVRLEPLREDHVDGLAAAAAEDRATYDWTAVPDGAVAAKAWVDTLLAERDAGEWIPFAQVSVTDDRPVGMTNYLEIRTLPGAPAPFAVEIGGTWLAASAQRTGINVEAKLLLLTFAFEQWQVARVDLKTDARNQRSRDAILAIGASFEGVLRRAHPSRAIGEEGELRDTAMFSILADEWPRVRERLTGRLGR
jgi:RimJ/RimL family protein N-acetyltransferase